MEYKLAVVVLLVIYFIFAYQVGMNADEYCMADNSRDRNLAFCGMIGSLILAGAFLIWAKYEYDTDEDAICNLLLVFKEEKKRDDKIAEINAPDPNIKNAEERNRIARERADRSNAPNLPSSSSTANLNPVYPTSEFDKYMAVDKSPELGNVNDYY